MRRLATLFMVATLVGLLIPITGTAGATATVAGTLVTKAKLTLSPTAVAVVTIVDQQATTSAGTIIGEQRIDAATLPGQFAVTYDDTKIDKTHSYAVYASVVDGGKSYDSIEPVPVITGGPTSGVAVEVFAPSSAATGKVAGTITRTDKTALSPKALAEAALIRQDTGTLVARQVIPLIAKEPIAFAIPRSEE